MAETKHPGTSSASRGVLSARTLALQREQEEHARQIVAALRMLIELQRIVADQQVRTAALEDAARRPWWRRMLRR